MASSLLTSLVACWPLQEPSGQRNDIVGGYHATDTNTVTQATGPGNGLWVPKAGQFTAANTELLIVSDVPALSGSDRDFSIALWIRLDSVAAIAGPLGKGTANSAAGLEMRLQWNTSSGGILQWLVSDGTNTPQITVGAITAADVWHHVVVWHDSVNNVIGGQLNADTPVTLAHTTGVQDTTGAFEIGRMVTGTTSFNGKIANVCFWDKVLTAAERSTLYNSGQGLMYPFNKPIQHLARSWLNG